MLESYAQNIFETEMPATNKRPSDDVAPSSPEKRPKFASAGVTIYNRKEGNHALPSPTRMVLELPLNVGQHEKVAEIVAGIAENGTPSQNLTATGTAKALRVQWNTGEYYAILNGKQSMGGSMTAPVAESIVRSMSQVLVRARASGQAMVVVHPTAMVSSGPVSKPTAKRGPKPKPIVPIKSITEEMVKNRAIFGSKRLYKHLIEYEKLYDVLGPRPGDYDGRLAAMIELIRKLKSKKVVCVAI
jgi:hypothetical protein